MSEQNNRPEPKSDILLYETDDGKTAVRVMLDGDTVWLSQADIADLYQISVPTVNSHIKAIYEDGELLEGATIRNYLIVRSEGDRQVQRPIFYYNLDMILAVGYRVRSLRGILFRKWASERLKEYIVKGFTMDDERLKGGRGFADHFDELLERIRDIRASEARVYQKIRDIFKLASDYQAGETETQAFFARMQNRTIYAATHKTAPELIRSRADANKPNMGVMTFKGKVVRKQDVTIAKNYLDEREIDTLNRITVMFLDQAEFRAQRRQSIRMSDWEPALMDFLRQNELPVLDSPGSVSHDAAEDWSRIQYDQFEQRRRDEADAAAEARYIEDLKQTAKVIEEKASRPILKPSRSRPRSARGRANEIQTLSQIQRLGD
ncbi:MAG: virulence RhuM family protein [bacterium]|nr:virulence RhuM family protein [bacterium]